MRATCAKPASPLAENAFSPNQSGKLGWAEIPGFSPAKGAIFGCNLVLLDADGGAGTGKMVWGADLGNTASGCGIVTLLP